jgi:glyoxylase-like metal-dependent hydrolase (beta-lactamase superfamily II)
MTAQKTSSTLLCCLALPVLLSIVPALNAQDRPVLTPEQLSQVQIHAVAGKAGLYVIPGFDGALSGGNVAVLITDEGVVIVDNKFEYSYPDIMEQLRKVTDQPVRYVLNTHHHFDHAGSNADFMRDAPVIAHRNVRTNILRNDQSGAPEILYDESATVILGGQEINAYHFGRGHTNGDSVIYFPAQRTVHTGDLFIWGDRLDGSTLAPFIDYDNGGSAAEWTATLDGLLGLDFDTVIPGHGPILRKVDIRIFRSKFDQLLTRIQVLIGNGVTRDAIVEELDISDLNWPMPASRIESIYDELSAL